MNWWALDPEDVIETLGTNSNGLKEEERKRRLEKYGLNEVKGKEKSPFQILSKQFLNPLLVILIISTIAFLLLDFISEAIIVIIIV